MRLRVCDATGQDCKASTDHREDEKACHIVQFWVQRRMGMAQGNMVDPRNRIIDPQDQAHESANDAPDKERWML